MKIRFKSFVFALLIIQGLILLVLTSSSCSNLEIKTQPEYDYVDSELEPYMNEYLELSVQNNIYFSDFVTMGFKKISSDRVIGMCHFASNFREIDIDQEFWETASELERKALVFHELTHCYCGRGHDYGDGEDYPSALMSFFNKNVFSKVPWNEKVVQGYFDDGCATSIMHPVIQSYWCLEKHWEYYIKEMFNRCEPY